MAISDLFFLDSEGLHVPDYNDVLEDRKENYKSIYGEDVNLDADSQDGEWVAVEALGLYDVMQTCLAVYNSWSPSTAQTDALTRNVKINGLTRADPSNSTADLKLTGDVGKTITNGYAKDSQGRKWFLPSSTTIGAGGEVVVSASCEIEGSIEAPIDTINIIGTPARGWLTVTNEAAANAGEPVEPNADLRVRQSISTMFPSQSVFDGLKAAVAAVSGVTKLKGYENDTGSTDGDGITAHTIAVVVEGGLDNDIAEAIFLKKSVGCKTQGSSSGVVQDALGNNNTINFYRTDEQTILVEVEADEVGTYLSTTDDLIKQAVADYINSLNIGDDVYISKLYCPANLEGISQGLTFNITSIQISISPAGVGSSDLVIAFNELAICDVSNITVTVT